MDVPGTMGNILRLLQVDAANVDDDELMSCCDRCCLMTWHSWSVAWLTSCAPTHLQAPADCSVGGPVSCVRDERSSWRLLVSVCGVEVVWQWWCVDVLDDTDNMTAERCTSSEQRQTLRSVSLHTSVNHTHTHTHYTNIDWCRGQHWKILPRSCVMLPEGWRPEGNIAQLRGRIFQRWSRLIVNICFFKSPKISNKFSLCQLSNSRSQVKCGNTECRMS